MMWVGATHRRATALAKSTESAVVLRTPVWKYRFLLPLPLLALALIATLMTAPSTSGDVALWVSMVVLILGAWRVIVYPNIVVTATELRVVNPYGTTVIPWNDCTRFTAGYQGLRIDRQTHDPVIAICVLTNGSESWPGRTAQLVGWMEMLRTCSGEDRELRLMAGLPAKPRTVGDDWGF